jgi:hypothetical protein
MSVKNNVTNKTSKNFSFNTDFIFHSPIQESKSTFFKQNNFTNVYKNLFTGESGKQIIKLKHNTESLKKEVNISNNAR